MKLLAFELATEACSVALWIDGDLRERFEVAPRLHADLALPWADQLLAEAGIAKSQLDAIAVGRGPGAFTGVRLAIAIAQGVALALDKPVVPVSTLAALAVAASHPLAHPGDLLRSAGEGRGEGLPSRRVLAAIDARMGEVYTGAYELRNGVPVELGDEAIHAPAEVTLPGCGDGWYGVGTGFAAADGCLKRRWPERFVSIDPAALPHAVEVARLGVAAFARGEGVAADAVEPAYLRNKVALTLVEQQALRDSR